VAGFRCFDNEPLSSVTSEHYLFDRVLCYMYCSFYSWTLMSNSPFLYSCTCNDI